MRVRINTDGSVQCLYRDTLPFIGGEEKLEIYRASHVEYNIQKQCLEILTPEGVFVEGGFPKRQDAIDREIEMLEATL